MTTEEPLGKLELDIKNRKEMAETDALAVSPIILNMRGGVFVGNMVCSAIGYFVVTLFLNWVRATASLWIVWPLIIMQLGLYLSIFFRGYQCFKFFGINAALALAVFGTIAGLGRVIYLFAWEWVAIPLTLAIVIALRNVKVRSAWNDLRRQQSDRE